MPWKTNGDYYSFKADSIMLHAPTTSGVYGLFNFRHQILIGSAANIRSAVLHHQKHTRFRFRRFEPSGFTFEVCAPELRETRARELVLEYEPISGPQNPISFATLWRSWRTPETRAFQTEVKIKRQPATAKVVPISEKSSKPETQPRWHIGREQFGLAGALCGIVFLTVGIIGLVPHLKNMFDSVVRNPAASAQSSGQQNRDNIQLAKVPDIVTNLNAVNNDVANSSVATQLPSADNSDTINPVPAQAIAGPQSTPATNSSAAAVEGAKSAKRGTPVTAWSVQALATTDKQMANDWISKLKAKGYQAFVINADINGKTWHRVRIGSFETRQDAENLRAALKAKEGFRDAYVAGNDKAETIVALNRR